MAIYVRYDSVFISSEVVEKLVNWFDVIPAASGGDFPIIPVDFYCIMRYSLPEKSIEAKWPYLRIQTSFGLAA